MKSVYCKHCGTVLIWNREQSYLLCCQMQEMWQSELWKHSPSIQAKEKEWEIKKCLLFHKRGE